MKSFFFVALRTKEDDIEEARLKDELKSIDSALKKMKKTAPVH
jgi:hypothetical protein